MKTIFLSFLFALTTLAVQGDTQDDIDASLAFLESQVSKDDTPHLIESQFAPDPYEGYNDLMEPIVRGEVMLMDVIMTDGEPQAVFCKIDFSLQKENPSAFPLFQDLVGRSNHCTDHPISQPLRKVAAACREQDAKFPNSNTKSMKVSGFIFHQPKSGSSLLANIIQASSPETTRVISHANALSHILAHPGPFQRSAFVDALYLFGRTTNLHVEEKLFIKFSAIDTARAFPLVQLLYPQTKWIYVYRDPDVVLQKLMDSPSLRRFCAHKPRRNPSTELKLYLASHRQDKDNLNDESMCGALLANDFTLVVRNHEKNKKDSSGLLVDYQQDLMTTSGLKKALSHFDIEWNSERVEMERKKRANGPGAGHIEWVPLQDNVEVSQAVRKVNENFLFKDLEEMKFRL